MRPSPSRTTPKVATDFDRLAQQFSTAARAVDPEAPAADLVESPTKIRAAWGDAERYAHQLSTALVRLAAAASLAGVPNTERGEVMIPLVADITGCHRRRTWESWRTMSGRTRRWGALLKTGAVLRAADLNHIEPYALPMQMEVRQIPSGLGVRQIPHDPCDDEYAELQAVTTAT